MSGLTPDQQLELVAEAIQKSAEARKQYVRALARSAPDLDTYVEKLRKISEAEGRPFLNKVNGGSSLRMEAMKAQAIVFDDDSGHSLIIYRTGVFCWSYSIDGVPVGKTFLTRKRAIKAALSKNVLLPKRS